MLPKFTIEAFDCWLAKHSLRFEAIVVGGSALSLLGVIDRQTRDFDILDPELSEAIVTTAREFAAHYGNGFELSADWLNNGPIQLVDILPVGWRLRLRVVFTGDMLKLTTLGHDDLLKTKLFALCDRGIDLNDCIALNPTFNELEEAEPWLIKQDMNPLWPEHVRATLNDLKARLPNGF